MTLPPGFRFHPTDEELVAYYLKKRVRGSTIEFDVIADYDLYKCEPWDLPSKSRLPSDDLEWFFFSPRDRKYPNGSRTNRATVAGYWKATGRDRQVKTGPKTIGMKKTLVFYMGRAPQGTRTDWLMHEYRLEGEEVESTTSLKDAHVLCRVFKKNGFGPPKKPSWSSAEDGVDNGESSLEEKTPTLEENDVKPTIRLSISPFVPTGLEVVPVKQEMNFSPEEVTMEPSSLTDFGDDPYSYSKMKDGELSQWDGFLDPADTKSDAAHLGSSPSFESTTDGTKNAGTTRDLFTADNFRVDYWNQTPNFEDFTYNMDPVIDSDIFCEIDLPPLKDYPPSPPTLLPSVEDVDDYLLSTPALNSPLSGIQLRPKLSSSARPQSQPGEWTAPRRVLFKKQPVAPVAELVQAVLVEETWQTAAAACEDAADPILASEDVAPEASSKLTGPESEENGQSNSWAAAMIMFPSTESEAVDETQVDTLVSLPLANNLSVEPPLSASASDNSSLSPKSAGDKPAQASEFASQQSQETVEEKMDNFAGETSARKSEIIPHDSPLKPVDDLGQFLGSVIVRPLSSASYSAADLKQSKLKGSTELPPGIGTIHVNIVTISCSCDKSPSQPHSYNCLDRDDRLIEPGSLWRKSPEQAAKEVVVKEGQSGTNKPLMCGFFVGAVSAWFASFVFQAIWEMTFQLVESGVHIVEAGVDL